MTTTETARALARADCHRAQNRFGAAFLEEHLQVVAGYALRLADRLGADREVVELAAWLHDLAAVRDFATLPTHARDGARLAGEWLALQGLPAPRVEAVRRCVASHSAPVAPGAGTVEEVCLSNADVLAQLARPAYWFHYLHDVRGLSREEGRPWFRARATEVWTALAPEARALALAERAAVLGMVGPATGANGDHPAATASSGPAAASLAGQATPQAAQWSR